jgi:PAS domain S-box-containing protein
MALEDIAIGDRQTSISPMLAKHLFETSLDLILITDRRGQFIEISPSSMTILGYRPDEMTGRNGTGFIYPDDFDRTRNEMRQARRGGQTQNFETRYVHKSGSIVSLAWSGVWSESEQLHFFIGRDVTAAKLVERLKNEFVATMSHELRTPLTSIAGALGLLVYNAEATPASTLRLLTIAKTNCQRLLGLVSGVLDLDKAESGKVVFVLKRIEIRALVEQAIESNRGAAEGVGVRIGLNLISDAGEMRGDPDWLLKAVNNLLSNAIAFSLPDGEVVVGIETRGRNIRVSVRDHGPGIPDEFKGRVFEKFAQADNSDARTKGGVGLGLSVVKQIVTRLGGEVGFANAPGGGAIFHFEVPGWQHDETEAAATFDATPIAPLCPEHEAEVLR